eukprot:1142405-Pelagomonas_calceolata.AAC.8
MATLRNTYGLTSNAETGWSASTRLSVLMLGAAHMKAYAMTLPPVLRQLSVPESSSIYALEMQGMATHEILGTAT